MTTDLTRESFAVTVPGKGSGCGTLTRDQLNSKATQFAETLTMLGLKPGDTIAVLMGNRIEVPVIMLGARWAGIDALPLSTHVSATRLAQLIETLQPKLLIASDDCIGPADQLAELISSDIVRLLATNDHSLRPDWMTFDKTVDAQPARVLSERLNGRWLLTSGGSTGLQKIVEPQVAANGDSLLAALAAVPAAAKVLGFNEGHVVLVTGPLYHTMGSATMTSALDAGAKLVIMQQNGKWSARDFMDFIGTYGVTHTMMVPTMMSRVNILLDSTEPGTYNTGSLQAVTHGAAPCPESVKVAFMGHFPGTVFEVYGGTEGVVFTIASPEDWAAHPGTVGRPLNPVVIRDEEGQEVPEGTPGIIWGVIASGTTPMSYMGRPLETNECITRRNGLLEGTLWDIGYMRHGLLFITGRKKDMLIVGGENTYPIEIEGVLHGHPRVIDVAVVGIPHDTLGQVPAAAIEVIGGNNDTLIAELHTLCKEAGLSNHATPQTIMIVPELPRTTTGKMPKDEVLKLVLAAS
jgi:long-chain acyl-CoA synthetase